MSHVARILVALEDGPATCAEIACTLAMRQAICSATLRQLLDTGRVARTLEQVAIGDDAQLSHIYALPEHAAALAHRTEHSNA